MTDRHKQKKLTIRAAESQLAAWRKAWPATHASFNAFIVAALDSHVASLRTGRLRLNKQINAIVRRTSPLCEDPHCSQPAGHEGRCDFLREP